MVVVRVTAVIALLAVAALLGMWMLTRDRRYLDRAWQIGRVVIIALGIFFVLMLLERVIPL